MRRAGSTIGRLGCVLTLCWVSAVAAQTPGPTEPGAGPPELPAMVQWHMTPGGVRYAEISVGHGATPHDGQTVVVHFIGWLDDGMQFDNTYKRGKPFGFPLGAGQVIKGWDEGVQGMRPGGKRRLVVPPQLGYGPQGIPSLVPPNATLIFDVELVRILDTPPPPPPAPATPQERRRP